LCWRAFRSIFLKGTYVGGKPFSDLANAKFSLAYGFGDEFVCRDGLQLEMVAVDAEKGIRRGETDSFVAIEESMIVRKRLHESRGFVDDVVIIAILGAENSCFEKALITKSVNPAKFVDELTMHFYGFRHGQIDVARREILFRGHGVT